jgi:cytochrome c oxidase subunit 2
MWREWIPFVRSSLSPFGGEVDLLFVGLMILSAAVVGLLFFLMIFFAVRYRTGSSVDRRSHPEKDWRWEVGWTSATFVGFLLLFVWGASLFYNAAVIPAGVPAIYIVGKQWMWKAQHQAGAREINELHIPTNTRLRLVLASEDVIHSFFIPALRKKQDAVPGRFAQMEIEARRPGVYPFFCAEYCGTDHSHMVGKVVALTPSDYEKWLAGEAASPNLASQGESLFQNNGCAQCHRENGPVRAPPLDHFYGSEVERGGRILTVDEEFLRDAIVSPRRHPPPGYEAVMPSYEGKIPEEDLVKIVAYLKSLAMTDSKDGGHAR